MQVIVFRGDRQLELLTFPEATHGPNDVLVRVEASGVCGSDLHIYRGPKEGARGYIAGHEPAGVIVEAGSKVPTEWVGRAVMMHHYFGCGVCDQCHAGWTQLCRRGDFHDLMLSTHRADQSGLDHVLGLHEVGA